MVMNKELKKMSWQNEQQKHENNIKTGPASEGFL